MQTKHFTITFTKDWNGASDVTAEDVHAALTAAWRHTSLHGTAIKVTEVFANEPFDGRQGRR